MRHESACPTTRQRPTAEVLRFTLPGKRGCKSRRSWSGRARFLASGRVSEGGLGGLVFACIGVETPQQHRSNARQLAVNGRKMRRQTEPELPPLLAVLQQRRLQVETVGQQARTVEPPAPPPLTVAAPVAPAPRRAAPLPAPRVAPPQATARATVQRTTWDGACACKWASGLHCEALLRARPEVVVKVGEHIMRGGTDEGCPGRRV